MNEYSLAKVKLCLFIEYQAPDNYMYIYQIDKNCMLKSFGGI